MARTLHQASVYVCSSCRHALTRGAATSSHMALNAARSFSSSSQRSKALPTFHPTSSPELDALLSSWRQKVFLPSTLSPQHQDLIHKPSRQDILLNTQVTVTLPLIYSQPSIVSRLPEPAPAEEDIQLQPQERWDRPNLKKSLREYAEILVSTSEISVWETLSGFLEGLRLAHYKVPSGWLQRVVRKAGEVEPCRLGVILRCAEMTGRTNFKLSDRGVTRELLLAVHNNATRDLVENETGFERAFEGESRRVLDRLVLLLEELGHCGRFTARDLELGLSDLRGDALLVGTLLEFAAGRALLHHEKKDVQGHVGVLVQRLLAVAEQRQTTGKTLVEMEGVVPSIAYEEVVVLKNAMTMALNVDMAGALTKDKELSIRLALQQLQKRLNDESRGLHQAVEEKAKDKPRRALKMHKTAQGALEKMQISS